MPYLLSDIPRPYTALAEWLACLVCILSSKKKLPRISLIITLAIGFLIQLSFQVLAGMLDIMFWVPCMVLAVVFMFLLIFICCKVSLFDAGYICARAFMLAEFSASFGWQVYCNIVWKDIKMVNYIAFAVMITIYMFIYLVYFFLQRKIIAENEIWGISSRELIIIYVIVVAVFIINNINFVFIDANTTIEMQKNLMYVRTLVDFCGLIMLYAYQKQRRDIRLSHEVEVMNYILQRQYEMFQQSKENIDLINIKYHDLKHQINVIKAETDLVKRDGYLSDLYKAINSYEIENKTGHPILDVVLNSKAAICLEKNINLTCIADGKLLDFMDAMDICTIFGNTLENAIESVEKLHDFKKRMIKVAVYKQHSFLMMRFENYFEDMISFTPDGIPKTTKKDHNFHGFGIKSIKNVIAKYDGNITINTADNWFILRILIPL